MSIEKEAEKAFQSLPLEEREKLCSILQAFTLGYKMAKTPGTMTIDTCKEPCNLLKDACLIAGHVKELEELIPKMQSILNAWYMQYQNKETLSEAWYKYLIAETQKYANWGITQGVSN